MVAGAVFGAVAVEQLHAQAKAGAYAVAVFNDASDWAAWTAASKDAPTAIAAAGGKVLARGDNVSAIDSAPPLKRLTIIWFDSAEKAKGFLKTPGMKDIEAAREKLTKSGVYVLDAMAN
jgi:uncharacterized protein (DUF1330 family)